jgi:hypothetical protein
MSSYLFQVKKDEMGLACSKNGEKRNAIGFWWEIRKKALGRPKT